MRGGGGLPPSRFSTAAWALLALTNFREFHCPTLDESLEFLTINQSKQKPAVQHFKCNLAQYREVYTGDGAIPKIALNLAPRRFVWESCLCTPIRRLFTAVRRKEGFSDFRISYGAASESLNTAFHGKKVSPPG